LILEKDNPSGLPENADQLMVPVRFKTVKESQGQIEEMTIKVYFPKTGQFETDCRIVNPINRKIPKTTAVAKAAITELLKGPTEQEKEAGFFTSLNPGVKLNSLSIIDGVASVDFSEELDKDIGGSCRVTSISSQISETLKQFPTVQSVKISINGRTEDILQP
jgi:spore germination protein GerM